MDARFGFAGWASGRTVFAMAIIRRLLATGLTLVAICALSAGTAQAQIETFAYITNAGDGTVSVLRADGSLVTTIIVGTQPYGIAAKPDGTLVYVANSGSNDVSVIDTSTNTVVHTVAVGSSPKGIAITPDGTKAYVANNSGNSVSVLDLLSEPPVVSATIGTGGGPSNIAFTPETPPRAFVTNTNSHNVTVIDTASDAAIILGLSIGAQYPEGIAIDSDGIAFVADRYGGVSVVDTNSYTWRWFSRPGRPIGIAVSGKLVYVSDNTGAELDVGDFTGWTPGTFPGPTPTWQTPPLSIGPSPVGVAMTPDQGQAWVASAVTPGTIAIVDNTAVPPALTGSTAAAGAQPTWIAFATLDTSGSAPEAFELELALRRVKILQRGRHKDYFWVDGTITLDPESDGLDLQEDGSSIVIGPTTFDIPAGSFISLAGGRLLYFKGQIGDTWLRVILVEGRRVTRYRLAVFGHDGEFPGITSPVTVGLMLGNDSGEATKKAWIR
jgi:YVTN family beta-propeller protein